MRFTYCVLAVAVILVNVAGDTCPYPQPCHCDASSIQCHKYSLKSLPRLQQGSFPQHDLDISFCGISSIVGGQLPAGLVTLASRYSPLQTVGDQALIASASSLNSIFIEGSKLTELPSALMFLTNLTSFHWSENPMAHWNTTILSHLSQTVTTLMIENMNLNTTNLDWLSKFTKVESLSLYHTQITAIPQAVTQFSKLQYLQLSSNRITSITSLLLPASLQSLRIFSNAITNVQNVRFLGAHSDMRTLQLSNNPITHINTHALRWMVNLTSLDLSATALTRLPLTLTHLTRLTDLDLHNIPKLVCTCQEAGKLVTWYRNVTSSLTLQGRCGDATIAYFLTDLAPSCPGNKMAANFRWWRVPMTTYFFHFF